MMRTTRGAVMCLDASNAWADSDVGLVTPKPSIQAGRARRSRSTTEQGSLPVSAGIKC